MEGGEKRVKWGRMEPKWGQNGAKMGPKWSQNGAKTGPKWGQNGAKTGPKWGQNGAKTEPKWGQIALNVGHKNPQRVRQWEKGFVSEETGLELGAKRPKLGPNAASGGGGSVLG